MDSFLLYFVQEMLNKNFYTTINGLEVSITYDIESNNKIYIYTHTHIIEFSVSGQALGMTYALFL